MADSVPKMKRMESRKRHSWWWDSHISPKNSKWLAENLEDMDQSIKRMLKLIEEDGDSFAKKAEMYYEKRPVLVSHVEEFYRMYRSLAERYDNLTGELRKSIPSDLQSQGSGISDSGSELTSPFTTPKQKPSRRRSSQRAAGFDFFLGSGGGSSDLSRKESDSTSSSLSGSDSESDGESSRNNSLSPPVNGNGKGLHERIVELEAEVLEVKEKLRVAEEENSNAMSRVAGNGNYEELLGRITWYDEELKVANERLRLSEEEITRLNAEIESQQGHALELREQIGGLEANSVASAEKIEALENKLRVARSKNAASEEEIGKLSLEIENKQSNCDPEAHFQSSPSYNSESNGVDGLETRVMDQGHKIKELEDELKIRNDRLQLSEEEIARLKLELEKTENDRLQLESSHKEIELKRSEIEREKQRILDLQEKIRTLEQSVSECNHEIGNFTLENSRLREKVSSLSEYQTQLETKLRNWESKARSLEEEIKRIETEKMEYQDLQATRETGMQSEIKQLKTDIAERSNDMEEINKSFDALKLKYDMLMAERDQLNANVLALTAEISSRDDHIHQKDEHLHRLHMEHVELIAGSEVAHELMEGLKTRVKKLEEEVEKQTILILDGAEQKREAIRQLCFSLEHYRNGYRELRQAFLVHKRPAVLAT